MPICNMCESSFDVETEPGALMFGHPSTVKEAVPVWKAHICQKCERVIVGNFKLKPKKFRTVDEILEMLDEAKKLGATSEQLAPLFALCLISREPVELSEKEIAKVKELSEIDDLSKIDQELEEESVICDGCGKGEPSKTKEECICGAKLEHMGDGRYGKWHRQDCPMFDGDHPEICKGD